jgi:non-specific serine/threonine protein kinase
MRSFMAAADSTPGKRAGLELSERYRIERELGRGGMAAVYLAEDTKHRRKVALKVVDTPEGNETARARFEREIAIAAGLSHPHIVPLFDSGVSKDGLFYVMPFIEGETLRARLHREPRLPLDEALRLTREIASGLAHAHQHGLIHRDIKPENVLLADGIALVCDFGIARAQGAAPGEGDTSFLTQDGARVGTPRYMSPEQILGEELDARSDLYALALVLYEMLAGRPAFEAPAVDALLRMQLAVEPQALAEVAPGVPSALSAVVQRALSKSRAERFDSVSAFASALEAARSAPSSTEPVPERALPRPRTAFIGRELELAECRKLLEEHRLLTLTGVGGSGKTRLALALAASPVAPPWQGVWFVDLAVLADPSLVPETVAAALGVREEPELAVTDAIARRLGSARALLLLDNCEHVLSAVALLADRLLDAAPHLRLLATSREGLGISGERLYAVGSLRVPSAEASRDRRAVESADAVRLLLDRARAAVSGFALDDASAPVAAEICRRLDGIPLAIELAAARVKLLSLEQIRDKLDDRFRLLTGGSKTALPRHQTLRAALQWSYEQLSPEEQALLALVSAFAGGASLEAIARVRGEGDEVETMELLGRLVDKSLIQVEREAGAPRYRLLETVRQYAGEKLAESGAAGTVRERHLAEFRDLAERAYADRFTGEERWARVLEHEHDNLRLALETARRTGAEAYLELAGSLTWFWHVRSHLVEGFEHLTAALAASDATPPRPARARALMGSANVRSWRGDTAAALAQMQESLAEWRVLGERSEMALALEGIGWVQFLSGEDTRARETFAECYALQRERGDPVLVNRARVGLAQVLVALGEAEEARAHALEIVTFSARHGDRRSEHFGWHFLADCALMQDRYEESLTLYRKSLMLARAIGDRVESGFEVQGVGMSLCGLGERERAVFLQEATLAEWESVGAEIHVPFWDALVNRFLTAAARSLGPEAAQEIREAARRVPYDSVVDQALADRIQAAAEADTLFAAMSAKKP